MDDPYLLAAELSDRGKNDIAWKIIGKLLIDDPLNVRALVVGSSILRNLEAHAQAYHLARTASQLAPENPSCWTTFGHVCARMGLNDDAESAYLKGLTVARNQHDALTIWVNLSALYIDTGRFTEAKEYVQKILTVDPTNKSALTNQGFCQLAEGDWNGWKGYHGTIGCSWRKRVVYKDEPEWDGTPGKSVVLYADQGLGDEISFASMIPDAADICRKLIIDCDGRLEGLFKRSFPQAKVYGTRVRNERWAAEDRDIEASLPLGQIGEFFRTTDDSFPGTPYLTPCPVRTKQWREWFHVKQKPVIGIAWTGGVPHNNSRNRRVSLEQLLPALSLDAHFVSLQYKDAAAEIEAFTAAHPEVDLVQYPWATLTEDYDDTAALVASCDYVLCIQTAVGHTAGALGIPVTVLLPTATTWRYGTSGDSIPWYRSMKIIRQQTQGDWSQEIERARRDIADFLAVPRGAREAARERHLWHGQQGICADGVRHHPANGGHAPPGLRLRLADEPREKPQGVA